MHVQSSGLRSCRPLTHKPKRCRVRSLNTVKATGIERQPFSARLNRPGSSGAHAWLARAGTQGSHRFAEKKAAARLGLAFPREDLFLVNVEHRSMWASSSHHKSSLTAVARRIATAISSESCQSRQTTSGPKTRAVAMRAIRVWKLPDLGNVCITPAEAAVMQTFPSRWKIRGKAR